MKKLGKKANVSNQTIEAYVECHCYVDDCTCTCTCGISLDRNTENQADWETGFISESYALHYQIKY